MPNSPTADALGAKAQDSRVPLQQLRGQHLQVLLLAIRNVVASEIAQETFGQIIDGLPLADVATDIYTGALCPGHFDLFDHRTELSPGVAERAQQLWEGFDLASIRVNPETLHAFQSSSSRSRAFNARLVELTAVSIHYIANWLFHQEPVLPPDHPLVAWRPDEKIMRVYFPDGYPTTLFRHQWYRCDEQYPEGVADRVGYWAENRIFGGVVLFDRRSPDVDPDADPGAVYLHPDRSDVIYRIIKMTDEQKHQLIQFLLSDTPSPACPLPIIGNETNRERVDPEEPIESTGIYRDKWERKPLTDKSEDIRWKDVADDLNYLSQNDWLQAGVRSKRLWGW